ncbi:D-alanyl-D-alanine carboxypeptidase precursor [Marinibacterium anthonyi]|nr:D-alanyl-D-alanine carboxypeptidase precursor [Marinibacterium anthonyi]
MHSLTEQDILDLLPKAPEGQADRWPGSAMAILRGDDVQTMLCHGLASVEHRVAITDTTVFRIASVTKHFLCAAVVILADEGKLDIDAPLVTYLPGMQPIPGSATLRQAMTNTSGIRDHLELWYIAGGGLQVPHRLRDSIRLCERQEDTNFAPGSSYLYSNANFLLLSKIVEDAAGQSLAAFLDDRFFTPLGMTRTALRVVHHEVVDDLATPYTVRDKTMLERGRMTTEIWGEGAIQSCLKDLVTWARYVRADPDGIIARLKEPAVYTSGVTGTYGLGLRSAAWRGMATVSHTGLWPGYLTEFLRFEDADVTLICLSNVNALDPWTVHRKMAEKLFPEAPEPTSVTPDATAWAKVCEAGTWYNPKTLDWIRFAEIDGKPTMATFGEPAPLICPEPTLLAPGFDGSDYAGFDISTAAQGTVTIRMCHGGTTPLVPLSSLPEGAARALLPGTWYCRETDSKLIIGSPDAGFPIDTPAYRGHDWTSTLLDGGLLMIEDATGPWPRRFWLKAEAGDPDTLVMTGPRVRRLVFRRL